MNMFVKNESNKTHIYFIRLIMLNSPISREYQEEVVQHISHLSIETNYYCVC